LYFILLHGRRINEALSLTWENIDFYQKSYNLDYSKTKTRKNQYYFLEDFQISELKKMKTASPNSKYVFENKKTKKPITYTSVFRIHKKLRIELNLPSFTIHSIRHMVGFLVVNNGFSLEITAKILGHSNIASTQRYAVLEMNKAKNAYKNISQQYFTTQSPRLT
jgi:integrase